MVLVGYSKYKSKDGTKKGTWITIGYEYAKYETAFGFKTEQLWAEYSIDIDNSLVMKPITIEYESTSTGKPKVKAIIKAKI